MVQKLKVKVNIYKRTEIHQFKTILMIQDKTKCQLFLRMELREYYRILDRQVRSSSGHPKININNKSN